MFSTCAKCGGHHFRLQEQSVQGANYKLSFVQCATCQVPIGALEYYDSGALLKKQEKKLEEMERKLAHIEHALQHISQQIYQQR